MNLINYSRKLDEKKKLTRFKIFVTTNSQIIFNYRRKKKNKNKLIQNLNFFS